jgi:spermidine/putrescine transport system ATP-binding protein
VPDPHQPARGAAAAPVVIAIDDVSKRFGDVVAVSHASLEVRRGEFFALLGPSGCGKTTLLRLIAGFETVTSGAIRLEGNDVSRVPPYRRNVNTVFQQYALFPHLSVADNVAFGPRMHRGDPAEVQARVAAMLDVVRLAGLADRRPSELSGGQRQRVALARALINQPSALLLDEPLSALDLKLRQAMQVELKRIQREVGITFVFVTHDQGEALAMSDRIAVMHAGRIEQVGSPEEIYESPATPFVAGFIGSANLLPATVEALSDTDALVRLAAERTIAVPRAGAAADVRVGDRVSVMIRPERVRVTATEPADDPAVPVTLVELSFQGPVVRCLLRDASGGTLTADVAPQDRASVPGAGAHAFASWPRVAARLLPAPDTA